MKIKKHFSFSSKKQIWRLLISDAGKLIIESRDLDTKEVYFNCIDLYSGGKLFSDYQFEEKSWIGIETIHNEILFLHKYDKPDMPVHRGISAFDLNEQKILWNNDITAFLFAYDGKIYTYQQGFEDRFFYAFDFRTGELVEELGNNYKKINSIREQADNAYNWGVYNYPQQISTADERTKQLITKYAGAFDLTEGIEFNILNDVLMFNFHTKINGGAYDNVFMAVDLNKEKILLEEKLNEKVTSLFTDSFFIYKNFLFLLKEKNEIKIFNLE
jgi:hypothetical protein